jgi:hypothetical protein
MLTAAYVGACATLTMSCSGDDNSQPVSDVSDSGTAVTTGADVTTIPEAGEVDRSVEDARGGDASNVVDAPGDTGVDALADAADAASAADAPTDQGAPDQSADAAPTGPWCRQQTGLAFCADFDESPDPTYGVNVWSNGSAQFALGAWPNTPSPAGSLSVHATGSDIAFFYQDLPITTAESMMRVEFDLRVGTDDQTNAANLPIFVQLFNGHVTGPDMATQAYVVLEGAGQLAHLHLDENLRDGGTASTEVAPFPAVTLPIGQWAGRMRLDVIWGPAGHIDVYVAKTLISTILLPDNGPYTTARVLLGDYGWGTTRDVELSYDNVAMTVQ